MENLQGFTLIVVQLGMCDVYDSPQSPFPVQSPPGPADMLGGSHLGSAPNSLCRTDGHTQSALGSSWQGDREGTCVSSAEGGQTWTYSPASLEKEGYMKITPEDSQSFRVGYCKALNG